ncbi:MAG TPA: ABC transporter permease [Pseudonocardiaceae bacterium]|nr:ABC transporter permease [Pseudonocardiaceae bacterium]
MTITSLTTANPETPPPVFLPSRRDRILGRIQNQGAFAVLILVVVIASIGSPGFASGANILSILVGNAYPALLALGMTFVIISGGIDLSVGSVFALGGVLASYGASHGGILLALALPIVVAALIGLAQGLMVARAGMAPFIVTLAGMLFARGLLQAISHEGQTTYEVPAGSAFLKLGQGNWAPIVTVAVLFVLGGLVLARSRFGHNVYAVGGNENAATLMGVAVRRTKVWVYVLSAVLAGVAGLLNASSLGSGVTAIGVGYELTAIAVTVIGGTLLSGGAGSVLGTVAGVLLLAVIQNLIGQYISQYGSSASAAVNGAFLAVVVLLQTYLSRARRIT